MRILVTGTNRLFSWQLIEDIKNLEHDVQWVLCDTFSEIDAAIKRTQPEMVIDDWKRRSFRRKSRSHSFMSAAQIANQMSPLRQLYRNIPWIVLTTAEGCLEFQEELLFVPVYLPTFKTEDLPAIFADAQTKMHIH